MHIPSESEIDFEDLDFDMGVIMIQFVQRAIEKLSSAESVVTNAVDLKSIHRL